MQKLNVIKTSFALNKIKHPTCLLIAQLVYTVKPF